ncbi:hypothetical protein Avbf_04559 [Armadillidium vulgare]|nr:hypothetical protein Avbf_04559 [Armadillidium vulgare]
MKVINSVKVEKDNNSLNFNNNPKRIDVIHQEQFVEENDQRFDSLQTREEIVVTKNNENDEESDSKNHLKKNKSKTKLNKYKTKFSEKWKADWRLKAWIQADSNNPNKVLCQCCNVLLRAHKTDLYKHAVTYKHRRNVNKARRVARNAKESGESVEVDRRESDQNEKEIVLSVPNEYSQNITLKKEKIDEPCDPYIVVGASENVINYSDEDENENGNLFISYTEEDESPPDQEISEITHKVGLVLIKEITNLLQTNKNILKFFKDRDEDLNTESNIIKLTKICVGHLSQKYLVESTMESINSSEKNDLSYKWESIEEKLEAAVSELKFLKRNLNEISSQSLPITTLDLSKIFGRPCEQ